MTRSSDASAIERELAAYYDQEADDRADRPLERERVDARDAFVRRCGAQRGRLLEVGTGAGRDTRALVHAGFDVVGIDLSGAQARHAAMSGAHLALGSVRCLPFSDGAFAAGWTMSTLMHIPDAGIAQALRELRRVLAPGAPLAVGVWGGADREAPLPEDRYDPPRLFSRRSDERWRAMLGTIGTVEEVRTWGHEHEFHYQWAVVRRA